MNENEIYQRIKISSHISPHRFLFSSHKNSGNQEKNCYAKAPETKKEKIAGRHRNDRPAGVRMIPKYVLSQPRKL